MTKEELFNYEKKHLSEVINTINKKIKIAQNNFKKQQNFRIGFSEGKRGTQFTRQAFMSFYATEVNDLKTAIENPYFGRFQFKNKNDQQIRNIYIGRKAITDENNDMIAYDWRSPICSMYYDYGIGDAEYTVNNKKEQGTILGKRQIIIKKGELQKVEEEDVISNDLILLKYLSDNASSRLKSIIATIQREQNKIIRSPLNKNYIVQGVAGSGKTTVALHRIAYLLYTEAKNVNESEFMILGPNKYFLNYISELLPDLDIKNVSQSTYEEIALKCLKSKVKVETKNETLQNVLNGDASTEIIEYKSSIKYLNLIEHFIESYIVSHLQDGIYYEGIELCSKEKIQSIYNTSQYLEDVSYFTRINNFIKSLTKNIKSNSEDLCHSVWMNYRNEFLSLPKDHPRRQEIIDITVKIQDEIKKGCIKPIKEYFSFAKVSELNLYQAFIEYIDSLEHDIPVDIEKLKNDTLAKLKKKKIGLEDLNALLLINHIMNGADKYKAYSHLVIDEAQDISLGQYYVLNKIFPQANFDIYGDINQSIYDYQSVSSWDTLNNRIFDSKAELLELDKSYRTTKQISDVSNFILEYLGSIDTNCIAREGNPISINDTTDKKEVNVIISQIGNLLKQGYQTIAIICKDNVESKKLYNKLKKYDLDINLISEKNEEYQGGITIISSYLSKGLEFDAAILYNASKENYSSSVIDQKLLYVAITRAMHDLYINYDGEIAESLKQLDNNYDHSAKKLVR